MAEQGARRVRGKLMSHAVTLADLGIEQMQASRWQLLARMGRRGKRFHRATVFCRRRCFLACSGNLEQPTPSHQPPHSRRIGAWEEDVVSSPRAEPGR